MANRHGKNTKITVNTTEICVTAWSVNTGVEETEATTTCSGGFSQTETGLKNAEFSFTVYYNTTEQESAGALATVEEGDTIDIAFFAETTDLEPWYDMPTARVTSISATGDVNSLVTIEYSGNSNGEYAVKDTVS